MHVLFTAARRARGESLPHDDGAPASAAPGVDQLYVVRDPQDESEWQYLGNPEVATRSSLSEMVDRFVHDCRGADGRIDSACIETAAALRDALLASARRIERLLTNT